MPLGRLALTAALSLLAGLAVACGSDGGGDSTLRPGSSVTPGICSRPLAKFTEQPITKERLDSAIVRMREVESAAAAGAGQAANAAFAGDTHAVTHDIDEPLRDADPALAEELCAAVIVIEQQLGGNPNLPVLSQQAGVAAGLLEEAGPALGVSD
jgi:hypothetical protein